MSYFECYLFLPQSLLVLLFYIFEKIFGQKNIRESEIKNGRGSEENKQIFWKNIQFCSLKMYTRYSSKRFGAFSFPKDLKLTELNAEWHLRVSQYETQQRREATWCMMNNVKLLQRWEGFEVWIEAGISCGMSKQERKIWEKKYASKREKKNASEEGRLNKFSVEKSPAQSLFLRFSNKLGVRWWRNQTRERFWTQIFWTNLKSKPPIFKMWKERKKSK